MKILRSILAIIVGYAAVLAVVIPTHIALDKAVSRNPHIGPVIFALDCVAGLVGGLVAASVAAHRRLLHAVVLGLIMCILGLLMAIHPDPREAGIAPAWYVWSLPPASLITAWLGGALRQRLSRKSADRTAAVLQST